METAEVGCELADGERTTRCNEDGSFDIELFTASGLPALGCTVVGQTFACDARNAGAHWEENAGASGTLTPTALAGDWTFTSVGDMGDTGEQATCEATGALVGENQGSCFASSHAGGTEPRAVLQQHCPRWSLEEGSDL